MDRETMKSILRQCAPTLTGVKAGSLVKFDRTVSDGAFGLFSSFGPGIGFRLLRDSESRQALLYDRELLDRVLGCGEVRSFLVGLGYPEDFDADSALDVLAERMSGGDVPHEIGVFLGYPLCDVIGFMDNRGRNYKCLGCWKVYGDIGTAEVMFTDIRRARADVLRRFDEGCFLSDISAKV